MSITATAIMSMKSAGEGALTLQNWRRMGVAVAVTAAFAWSGLSVLRVDGDLGAPLGPDRLIAGLRGAESPREMRSRAIAALGDRPIDGAAFRTLGQVAALEGDRARASKLFRIASRRDPRDEISRALLMKEAFEQGDAAAGVEHLDALLRIAPELRNEVLRALVPELGDQALRASVVSSMAEGAPWSSALLTTLREKSHAAAIAVAVMEDLARRRPLTPDERSVQTEALVRSGHAARAREIWLASLSGDQRALAGAVFDGGFEASELLAGEFAWRSDQGTGAYLSLERGDAASGNQSLRIDFEGRSVELRAPAQQLVLSPGSYTLSAAFDDRTDAAKTFVLTVSCASGTRIASLGPAKGSSGKWVRAAVRFEVPDDCVSQRLALGFPSHSMATAQVSGFLRLDDIAIRKALP